MNSTEKKYSFESSLKVSHFVSASSNLINLVEKTIANSQNIPRMADRFKELRHASDKKLELFLSDDENSLKVSQSTPDYETSLILPASVLKNGIPVASKKLFRFIMTKIVHKAFKNGQLIQTYIEFNLSELVDCGFYNSVVSARNHINESLDFLQTVIVSGSRSVGKGSNQKVYSWKNGNMFIRHSIENNIVRVELNVIEDWNFIISQFQLMPVYLLRLSSRAYDLSEMIFYLGRVNAKKTLTNNGIFKISYKNIQLQLSLPDVSDTKNPGRDIKGAVFNAVEEIVNQENKYKSFVLELENDPLWSVSDWLINGYLTVKLGEKYLESYKAIAVKRGTILDKKTSK